MIWVVLVAAGLLEVVWSLGLKYTDGFSRPMPSAITAIAIAGSMILLAHAAKHIPIGTAYAIWVGIGVLGATIGGIVLFGKPISAARVLCLLLLVVAIVGSKADHWLELICTACGGISERPDAAP